MFDAVRNNPRVVQIFLGLITLPFAFWGIDSYVRNTGSGSDVAAVGDSKITPMQFEQAVRDRQDELRQSLGAAYRPELLNGLDARLGILNGLIDQRVIQLEAAKKQLSVGDQVLRDYIARIGAFQENGKFSPSRYETLLRNQGMSQPMFEARLRQDLTLQQLVGTLSETASASATQAEALLRQRLEQRDYSAFRIGADSYADKVKLESDAAQKYYDEHKAEFEVPEKVRAEYLVFSPEALIGQIQISDKEAREWYDNHLERFDTEQRRASHILIAADGADKSAAKAKAEAVLKELRQNPSAFADLARKNSQDPGSAAKGGDLGFFGRNAMVKPFSDAVFRLKDNEISGLVETEYGYHIIKLTGIKPGKKRSFEDARPEIVAELARPAAERKFAELAESFGNTVYEQSDSLQPAAEKYKLKVQQSAWLPRRPAGQDLTAAGPLADDKLLAALFSEDSLKNKRNTDAIEIAPNTLVAARVIDHAPATMKPFAGVRADIEKRLRAREAAALAAKDGEARLAELRKGGDAKLAWSKPASAKRSAPGDLPPAAAQALFRADTGSLPAYVGVATPDAYTLYRITKVSTPDKLDAEQVKAMRQQYSMLLSQEDIASYVAALRQRYKIDINRSLLESKER